MNRQANFLPYLTQRENEKNVLICMHGRAMRIFLCLLLKVPLQQMDQFNHENLCLYHLEFNGNDFALIKNNFTEHLQGLKLNQAF